MVLLNEVQAMVQALGESVQQMDRARDALAGSGMIYSPRYGYAAFAVPLFDAFMKRIQRPTRQATD